MRLLLSDIAKADMREILRTTLTQFGLLQVPKYRALISEARKRLSGEPRSRPSS